MTVGALDQVGGNRIVQRQKVEVKNADIHGLILTAQCVDYQGAFWAVEICVFSGLIS